MESYEDEVHFALGFKGTTHKGICNEAVCNHVSKLEVRDEYQVGKERLGPDKKV
jgi:hypothetical protein